MRELRVPGRAGLFGLRRPRRGKDELIRPRQGHHVLVYKVDGDYIVDNVSLGARDDLVVRASHVSEVDMRQNAPVVVMFHIPSKDHNAFTVTVTFECTVIDPILVVRVGLTRPEDQLLTYVKSHHNASQMGLEFALEEVNDVRRYVDAQLTAYHTLTPPVIDGMRVQMASVEVWTPNEELAKSRAARELRDGRYLEGEKARHAHTLAQEQMGYQAELDSGRVRVQYDLDTFRQDSQQDLDYRRRRYQHLTSREQQAHDDELRYAAQQEDLRRRADQENFRRSQLREMSELIGSDPDRALQLAYLAGQLDAAGMAEQLRDDRERIQAFQQAAEDKDREERLQVAREKREDERRALDFNREEGLAKLAAEREDKAWQREEARRDGQRKREDDALRLQWKREDDVARQSAEREAARRQDEGNLQLIRDLIARGLLDAASVNLDKLVAQLGGQQLSSISVGDGLPELAADPADDDMPSDAPPAGRGDGDER